MVNIGSETRLSNCSDFVYGDYDHDEMSLCKCPKCGGFLTRTFPTTEGVQWQCKKCGGVLEVLLDAPDPDEVQDYEDYMKTTGILYMLGLEEVPAFDPSDSECLAGRICLVPEYAVKIPVVDYVEIRKNRPPKAKFTGEKVYGDTFTRSVRRDKGGEFIQILGQQIYRGGDLWKALVNGTIGKEVEV